MKTVAPDKEKLEFHRSCLYYTVTFISCVQQRSSGFSQQGIGVAQRTGQTLRPHVYEDAKTGAAEVSFMAQYGIP